MPEVNYGAVVVAALSAFLLGGLWYSPLLFLKPWQESAGINPQEFEEGHHRLVFVYSFVFALVAAFGFAILLGPSPELGMSLRMGLIVGFCIVAMSFGINYQFSNKKFKLLLIDGGYHVFQFVL